MSASERSRAAGRVAEVALLIAVAVAPLLNGSLRPPATAIFAALAAIALASTLVAARSAGGEIRWSPLAVPLGALAAATLLQLLPFPPGLVTFLEPERARVEVVIMAGIRPDTAWRCLSSDLAATIQSAVMAVGLLSLAIAAANLNQAAARTWLQLSLVVALAAFLIPPLVSLAGVPLPEWILRTPQTRALARFSMVNPNHAASFLALTMPFMIAQATEEKGWMRAAAAVLGIGGNLALFATLSRAGVPLALGAQLVVLFLAMRRKRKSHRPALLLVGVMTATLVAAVLVARPMIARFGDSEWAGAGRMRAARDTIKLVRDYPYTGVGRGAFSLVFARYSQEAGHARFGFVENEPLQAIADFGLLAGLAVLLSACAVLFKVPEAWRAAKLRGKAAAVGLAVLTIHNFVDFSWEGAGVAGTACVLAALLFRRSERRIPPALVLAVASLTIVLVVLSFSLHGRTSEQDVVRLEQDWQLPAAEFQRHAEAALRRHPADGFIADLVASRLIGERNVEAVGWIERALLLGPHDSNAHGLAGRALAMMRRTDQAAIEMRTALADAPDRDLDALIDETIAFVGDDRQPKTLASAIPPRATLFRRTLMRLGAKRRWPLVDVVAEAALQTDGSDLDAALWLVRSAMAQDDKQRLAERARALAAVDSGVETTATAAQALAQSGHVGEAEDLLRRRAGEGDAELLALLSRLLVDDDHVDEAHTLIDEALSKAVTQADKARLHLALSYVEQKSGNIHRAEMERRLADQLGR